MALERNLQLAAQKLSPRRAATVVVEERAAFDPSSVAEFNRRKAREQQRNVVFGNLQQNGTARAGLEKRFRTGTEANVFYRWERDWNDSTFATVNPAYTQEYGVQFRQPLLKGFGIRVNTANIATAKNDQRIAFTTLHDVALETVSQTMKTYWELVFAIRNRAFLVDSLERARNLQQDLQARVDAGALGPRDPSVAQAAAGVAVREEALVEAEDAIRDAEDRLKVLTDLAADPEYWHTAIRPSTTPPEDAPPLNPDRAAEIAIANRPDYQQVKIRLENDDITIRVSRNELLPQLDLVAEAAANGLNAGWGEAAHDSRSLDFYDMSFGFSLEYPLGNRAAKARLRRARIDRQINTLGLKALERQIQLEVRRAVRQVATNRGRLRAAELSVEAEQERLRAENIRFKEARVGTLQDVLDAEAEVADSQSRRYRALIDLNQSLVDVERFKGTLLEASRISLEDE
jgi:outer membrane protein TolC